MGDDQGADQYDDIGLVPGRAGLRARLLCDANRDGSERGGAVFIAAVCRRQDCRRQDCRNPSAAYCHRQNTAAVNEVDAET